MQHTTSKSTDLSVKQLSSALLPSFSCIRDDCLKLAEAPANGFLMQCTFSASCFRSLSSYFDVHLVPPIGWELLSCVPINSSSGGELS